VQKKIEKENEFLEKIQKHQPILHKISYLYTQNQVEREDMYQEIMLQLWHSYPSFKGNSKFSTWLYRVALNTAITITKKQKQTKIVFIENSDQIADTFDMGKAQEKSENIRILHQAISCLNQMEKAIILLWLEEKKYQEIAEIVGVSLKNVSVKVLRIKKKLAKIIKEMQ